MTRSYKRCLHIVHANSSSVGGGCPHQFTADVQGCASRIDGIRVEEVHHWGVNRACLFTLCNKSVVPWWCVLAVVVTPIHVRHTHVVFLCVEVCSCDWNEVEVGFFGFWTAKQNKETFCTISQQAPNQPTTHRACAQLVVVGTGHSSSFTQALVYSLPDVWNAVCWTAHDGLDRDGAANRCRRPTPDLGHRLLERHVGGRHDLVGLLRCTRLLVVANRPGTIRPCAVCACKGVVSHVRFRPGAFACQGYELCCPTQPPPPPHAAAFTHQTVCPFCCCRYVCGGQSTASAGVICHCWRGIQKPGGVCRG